MLSHLHGTNAFVGFTGATGASWNQQDILSWQITTQYQPIGGQSTITITTPTNNAALAISPTNVFIDTLIVTNSASTAKVEFFANTNKIGEADSPPFNIYWYNAPAGTYLLSAKLTDSVAGIAASSNVSITINAAPTVAIASPTNLQSFTVGNSVSVSGTAVDSDGTITQVQLFSNTNLLATFTNSTASNAFSFSWTNRPAGVYELSAVATDNQGMTHRSALTIFRVVSTNPVPSVQITSPANYTSVKAWQDLSFTANAFCSGGISNVAFYEGTNLLGIDVTATVLPTATNFDMTVHGLSPGNHSIYAIAASAGVPILTAQSPPITIDVQNEVPFNPSTGHWARDGGLYPEFDSYYHCGRSIGYDFNNALYVGLSVSDDARGWGMIEFTNSMWLPLSGSSGISAITANGTNLYVAGEIVDGFHIGRKTDPFPKTAEDTDFAQFEPLGDGLSLGASDSCSDIGVNAPDNVSSIHVFNGDLFVGGNITAVGEEAGSSRPVQYIATLTGSATNWAAVGTNALNGIVRVISDFNGTLIAGGQFTMAGSDTNVCYLAALVSNTWQVIGAGVDGPVYCLAVDKGRLFVGGEFTRAGTNTSANHIAVWDGTNWNAINGGVGSGATGLLSCNPEIGVRGIAIRNDEVYVTGHFTEAWNGTNSLVVNHVARAVWNPSDGNWTWYSLGEGLASMYGGTEDDEGVRGAAIVIHDMTNGFGYEVDICGKFDFVDGYPSQDFARWYVGQPDRMEGLPATFIQAIPYLDTYSLEGVGVEWLSRDATVEAAVLLVDGNAVATNNSLTNFYADDSFSSSQAMRFATALITTTNSFPSGVHFLQLYFTNSDSTTAYSASVPIELIDPDSIIAINPDTYFITSSNSTFVTNLYVLTNDIPSTNALTIIAVENVSGPILGTATIGTGSTNLIYSVNSNASGTQVLRYYATDGNTTNANLVTLIIQSHPAIYLNQPVDGASYPTSYGILISGSSFSTNTTISSVQIYVNGSAFGKPIAPAPDGSFSLSWRTAITNAYAFRAAATDQNGITSFSDEVDINVVPNDSGGDTGDPGTDITSPGVIAAITSPSPATSFLGFQINTNILSVREGFLDLAGSAYATNGTTVSYKVQLIPLANLYATPIIVTPGTNVIAGFRSGSVTNGSLGTADLSTVENGAYMLQLVVKDAAGNISTASLNISLDSNLKIGQFGFSEQDLILPVSGIPLTVTRTYNSLNPRSSDFGYGWNFSINSMDVALDEQREDWQLGGDSLPGDDDDDSGGTESLSVRTGGSRDVTLTLPDGRRVTFAFTPWYAPSSMVLHAQWTAPVGITATLTPLGSDIINTIPAIEWQDGGDGSDYETHDVKGWILKTQDGTQYEIDRGPVHNVLFDTTGEGDFVNVQAFGTPVLTQITQPSGDQILIASNSVSHYAPGDTSPTRSVAIDRDVEGRIISIHDPISGDDGVPLIRYVYDQNGNLSQVQKLVDRTLETYTTNQYFYTNTAFPHFITSIKNADGVPVARSFYDDQGRLSEVDDANGGKTLFIHSTTNNTEIVVDRLSHTNISVYDLRGNVIATTNALGQITTMAYDDNNNKTNQVQFLNGVPYATNSYGYDSNNNLLSSIDALNRTNSYTYNGLGQVVVSVDGRGFGTTNLYDPTNSLLLGTVDALGHPTTNFYNSQALLLGSIDLIGTVTTNTYDSSGNLLNSAMLDASGNILSTNSATYDSNGNRQTSTIWRHASGAWVGAVTSYAYDAQNRVVQTIDANGGTNAVIYDAVGRQQATVDALNHTNNFVYDTQGRVLFTTSADGTTQGSLYDAAGNRTNSTDQLNRPTQYVYDSLNRLTMTIYADGSSNSTVFDDVGRVQSTIDARGTTNAIGYDVAGQQVAVTNGWGSGVTNLMTYSYDANGNRAVTTDGLGRSLTNVYDALNRMVTNFYPDGTFQITAYDDAGRKISQTDQATNTTYFAYDGAGRLIYVTNALQQVTGYAYDEAGDQTTQVDALMRKTIFSYDSLGRRTGRTLPGLQSESFMYDAVGNLVSHTDFNGLTLTNQYDAMNRLTNKWQSGTSLETYSFDAAGELTNRVDSSGSYRWVYDNRGRVTTNATPVGILFYQYDVGGNLTNLFSGTTGGVSTMYQYDAINRLTNVIDNGISGAKNTFYSYDTVGNLQTLKYPNGVTNLWQYDTENRLISGEWKLGATSLASFTYGLGASGNRTNLAETINTSSRSFNWAYDKTYRLTNEDLSGAQTGTLGYKYDAVGNRTNRTGNMGALTAATNFFDVNDWLDNDTTTNNPNAYFDANGNELTNGANIYAYDYANRMTNASGGITIAYDANGNRIKKIVGTTTNLYLISAINPTGYAQVLEEFSATAGMTNLNNVYTYGMNLINQRTPSIGTNYFIMDGHGSTRLLADNGGNILNAFTYDAFGNLIASNTTAQTAYLYNGEQFDTDLNYYYLRARYLDCANGRFLTMDKMEGALERPLKLHKYLYCADNAIDQIDPTGNDFGSLDDVSGIAGFGSLQSGISQALASLRCRKKLILLLIGAKLWGR